MEKVSKDFQENLSEVGEDFDEIENIIEKLRVKSVQLSFMLENKTRESVPIGECKRSLTVLSGDCKKSVASELYCPLSHCICEKRVTFI